MVIARYRLPAEIPPSDLLIRAHHLQCPERSGFSPDSLFSLALTKGTEHACYLIVLKLCKFYNFF